MTVLVSSILTYIGCHFGVIRSSLVVWGNLCKGNASYAFVCLCMHSYAKLCVCMPFYAKMGWRG